VGGRKFEETRRARHAGHGMAGNTISIRQPVGCIRDLELKLNLDSEIGKEGWRSTI
jgi:hypothetical protein